MKKRIFSILTALALCLTLLPATVWAEGTDDTEAPTEKWADSADTKWYTEAAEGTTQFTISTATELAGLASLVNSGTTFSGKTITLGADIDLNSQSWDPIGNSSTKSFQGTFDGQGHTVSGLYVSISKNYTNTYAGLFGRVIGGTVKNLAVSGEVTAEVTASGNNPAYAGGVVGYHYGGNVENCSFSGNVSASVNMTTSSSTLNNAYAGGVVGYANSGTTVKNCYHTGTVTATATGSGATAYAGGVTGLSYATVTNCYHTGTVTASGGRDGYAGGVAGKSSGTVSNCYFLQTDEVNNTVSGIGNNASASGAESKTAAEFASGEVAWLLNGGENQDENSPWYQNLTGDDADGSPVLDSTHAQVVKLGTAYLNPLQPGTNGVYEISTAAELVWFANEVNSGQTSINAKLMDNIDLSAVCGATIGEDGAAVSWTPIGSNSGNSFNGTFDGQDHTVSGLYVSISKTGGSVYAGLFGYVYGGTVKNLAVSGEVTAEVTTSSTTAAYAGGVVGYHYGGNVENCSFSGNVSASVSMTSNTLNNAYAGGVVGRAYNTTLKNCYHTGTVTATATGSGTTAYAGGVAGSNYATVTNCYHTGTVTASGGKASYAGGVAGRSSDTVENCYFLQDTGTNTGLSGIGYDETSSISGESSNDGATPKTAAAFASGEVAHLLQGEQADAVWVQNLGTGGDSSPVLAAFLTADEVEDYTVYQVTFQTGNASSDPYAAAYANKDNTVTLPNDPDMGTGNVFVGWYNGNTEFTAETKVTEDMTVTAKVRPDISIDYETETLTGFVSGATYTITTSDSTESTEVTPDSNTLSVTEYIGKTVSIVRKSTGDTSVDSEAQELPIPIRPAAPSGFTGVNETFAGENDGKITGVTTAMEYKLSTADEWTACAGTEVTGLAPGSYQIRLAATSTAFASAAADVTIGTGDERTYTLNVTAPTFDSAAYGYAQPAAKAITISNSGNSASAISGVALSGDTSAFTLNKTDGATVQPGAMDNTTYTIQPAAGLGAGTYTATITVTYQDGETATATVSFTVTQAAQEAPADAPQLASRTTSRITLKTVAPNANGAAAEYGISTDGGTTWAWQASPEFTKLSSGKEYTFAVRYGATEDGKYVASPASDTAAFSTARHSVIVPVTPDVPPVVVTPTYPPAVDPADNGSVSVTPASPTQGDTVTVTPNPDKGYEVDSITVTDQNGNPVAVTDNGDGTYSFTQPAGKVTISVTYVCDGLTDNCPSYHLADVDTTKWYHLAVDFVVENGLMNGYDNGLFGPNNTLTRAELAQILYNKEGRPSVSGSVFTDVAENAWYADAVTWANRNGIVGGYGNGRFGPGDPITREQLAVMLWRYAGCPASTQKELRFTDADQVSDWALEAMLWATENGVINGYNGVLNPGGTATRAEAAQMLKNFIENI